MIFPRYSIRWLLAIVVAAALFFLCFSLAMRGHHWAAGVVAPGLGLLLLFAMFLVSYSVLYVLGSVVESVIGPHRDSANPFAAIEPAPAPSPFAASIPADVLPAEIIAAEVVLDDEGGES